MPSEEFTHEELKAIVASKMADPNTTAADILSTILDALEEPTEGMIIAANSLPQGYGKTWIWRAMIDASALGEQSDG